MPNKIKKHTSNKNSCEKKPGNYDEFKMSIRSYLGTISNQKTRINNNIELTKH
jgi:hypothetical protein